jgi:hypothetical protein
MTRKTSVLIEYRCIFFRFWWVGWKVQYWVLNSRLVLTKKVLYHLSHTPSTFSKYF